MSYEVAIKVENLAKCYQIYDQPRDRLKQFIWPRLQKAVGLQPRQYYREFWAVKDVSFEVKKGETVGILGFNGAGKSTLLQMICGTLNPTHGHIQTNGKISALLELGAGFNPEFTGRENVFMTCALYGMSYADIYNSFNSIANFASIGDFIDQPVKHYSSGMYARLAFSSAVHVNPAVLVVDEALSVGDMAFQEKSITRMKELRDSGTSILFVSHSISAVRNFCDRAVWLDNGQVRAFGERLKICDEYQNAAENTLRREVSLRVVGTVRNPSVVADAQTITIVFAAADKFTYAMGEDICIDIGLAFQRDAVRYGIGLIIYDAKGNIVSILNTLRDDMVIVGKKEKHRLRILNNHLAPGEYTMTLSIPDEEAMFSYDKWEHFTRFRVAMERNGAGLARVEGIVRCEHEWS
jgi:ABC-type polysaccharide/polyol phosphate transport system ATPase subunit